MDYENLSQLASLYALDTLDEAEESWVKEQFTHLPGFEAEVAETKEIISMLAYNVDPLPMASNLKARLFQRVAEEDQIRANDAITALLHQAETVDWRPYPLAPRVQFATVLVDYDTRKAESFLRSFGQVKFPEHRHVGDEEIVVLDGELVIGGQTYVKGDRIYSQPETVHQPETLSGCTLFIRASLDDEILL